MARIFHRLKTADGRMDGFDGRTLGEMADED
jgi:hypothetical protein